MSDSLATRPQPRAGILDIAPYVGGESEAAPNPELGRAVRLASNEGALGPSPRALAAYRALSDIHRYPDSGSRALREAISRRFDLDPSQIACSAGSDELIALLVKAYAGPGEEVLYSQHGFLMYRLAALAAGATPKVAPESNLTADVDALLSAVTSRTRLLFLANPNNPTGSYLSRTELARLHGGLPKNVMLVIDAAYAEFVEEEDYDSGMMLARDAANVIVMRTFSKLFALGGLRLGWAYGSKEVIAVLNRVRGPFNVSAPAQAAGVAAMEDLAFQDESRRHNTEWRNWLTGRLAEIGLQTHPSVANFVLVDFSNVPDKDAEAARQHLKADGILVRQLESYGLPQCLRISIGLGREMQALVTSLSAYLLA